jgi:hypothetical protein
MVPWAIHRMGEPQDVVQEAWRFGFEKIWLCKRCYIGVHILMFQASAGRRAIQMCLFREKY